MPDIPAIIEKPNRWDVPFDPAMSAADVDRILATAPFKDMDAGAFPKRLPLRGLVENDVRLRRFREGEIVVRQGDYGTSAFMVLSGEARVVLTPRLPASMLGRRTTARSGFVRLLAQLWPNAREPESFKRSQLQHDERIAARQGEDNTVKIFLQDVPRVLRDFQTEPLGPGEFFGEIAALSRRPRTASIFAESATVELVEIRWQGLRDLMRYDPALHAHIDRRYRENALASHLRNIPLFQRLSADAFEQLKAKTEFATYGDYDWSGDYKRLAQSGAAQELAQEPLVAQEGDYPNGVILIRAGFARLSQKFGHGHRTSNYLGAGQIYGFEEIAHNWRQPGATVSLQHSLRAVGYTHLLVVPTAVMEELVLPTIPKKDLPPLVSPAGAAAAPARARDTGAKVGADMLEFLAEHRFFNGSATMLIDLDRCTRCDDCVRACAATHNGNPRFLRHGPISGNIMVANACMHCADPVCMIGCPTGAIHRSDAQGQVVINPTTCIGCESCFNNCPYDAIRMVEVRDESGAIMADDEMKPILKATKCDLCVELVGGPACQRACPHGALVRMNMGDLEAFAKWLKP